MLESRGGCWFATTRISRSSSSPRPVTTTTPSSPAQSCEPVQEEAAKRAEPAIAHQGNPRLVVLRERIQLLRRQRDALPADQLGRIDEIDAALLDLAERHRSCRRAARWPAGAVTIVARPSEGSRPGRSRSPALDSRRRRHATRAPQHGARASARELGDPEQVRSELAGLNRALAPLKAEYRSLRDELATLELANPAPWVARTFGERPDSWRGETWDRAVRDVVAYRLDHDITDADSALGPEPADPERRRAWERERGSIDRGVERLDRGRGVELGMGDR